MFPEKIPNKNLGNKTKTQTKNTQKINRKIKTNRLRITNLQIIKVGRTPSNTKNKERNRAFLGYYLVHKN